MADLLKREPDAQVEVVDGGKGELTVLVDDHEVFRKGEALPEPNEVRDAVRAAEHIASPAGSQLAV